MEWSTVQEAFKLENGGEKSEKMGTNDETDDRDWRLETAGPSDPVERTESTEGRYRTLEARFASILAPCEVSVT